MRRLLFSMILTLFGIFTFGAEIIRIRLSDGESIDGKLVLPKDSSNVPVIVIFVHGTGPNTYLNKRKIGNIEFNYFDLFADEFTKRRVGFFTYNRRGVEIGDKPPMYDIVDSVKYAKYLPSVEVTDIESIISRLRKDKRFKFSRIVLLGASEGTIIASMIADRKVERVDALLLFGYANDNLFDIIKWQFSGAASMINLRKFFDINKDNKISRMEYESSDSVAVLGRTKVLQNASFDALDMVKDSILDYKDFGFKTNQYYKNLLKMIDQENDAWIWKNYFKVTSKWLKEHFQLEANKTRLLRVNIPVYIFHGTEDGNVPVEGVRDIESRFKQAGKTNLKCFIFDGHNHDLNYLDWPFKHKVSDGLNTIFNTSGLLLKQN